MRVAIIGAGMSGLCMGHKLRRAGIEDFTIFEKAGAVGGTWRENTYPGLSCDVPSRFYSYSWDPNPDWTHVYSPGAEIWRYFERAADRFGLRPHLRLSTEVTAARWVDGRWRLRTRDGREDDYDVVVSACGVLHHPRLPDIPGLDSFAGAAFHSARWDHSVPLAGRRIGIVGTGSTGVQLTCALAEVAARLVIFQRTAQWVVPVPNRRYSRPLRYALRRSPALNRFFYRFWQRYMELLLGRAVVQPGAQRRLIAGLCRANLRTVREPALRAKLTPPYEPMCKRLVMSAGFYRAVQRPSVSVVADGIERVEPAGVRTVDGALHELDVLVLATGFDAHAYLRPIEVTGQDGARLADAWRDGPRAYRTVALPGFPNLFLMMGPHSPIGNQSLIPIAETQADWVLRWIGEMRAGRVAAVAPTQAATDAFNASMRAAMPNTVWTTGCKSWYLGKDGLPELFPWEPERHRELLASPVLEDFAIERPAVPAF